LSLTFVTPLILTFAGARLLPALALLLLAGADVLAGWLATIIGLRVKIVLISLFLSFHFVHAILLVRLRVREPCQAMAAMFVKVALTQPGCDRVSATR
jgi:hypothetical protein